MKSKWPPMWKNASEISTFFVELFKYLLPQEIYCCLLSSSFPSRLEKNFCFAKVFACTTWQRPCGTNLLLTPPIHQTYTSLIVSFFRPKSLRIVPKKFRKFNLYYNFFSTQHRDKEIFEFFPLVSPSLPGKVLISRDGWAGHAAVELARSLRKMRRRAVGDDQKMKNNIKRRKKLEDKEKKVEVLGRRGEKNQKTMVIS